MERKKSTLLLNLKVTVTDPQRENVNSDFDELELAVSQAQAC